MRPLALFEVHENFVWAKKFHHLPNVPERHYGSSDFPVYELFNIERDAL